MLSDPSDFSDVFDLPLNLPLSSIDMPSRRAQPLPLAVRYDENSDAGHSRMSIGVLDEALSEGGFLLDPTRLFYHDLGAFKHDWSVYTIQLAQTPTVYVTWTTDLEVKLTGQAAVQFLRITKSRFMRAFAEAAGVDLQARAAPRRDTGMRRSRPAGA